MTPFEPRKCRFEKIKVLRGWKPLPPPPHFLLSGYSVNKLRETFHPQIALALRSGLMEAIYLKSVFAVCELNTYLCLVMRYIKSQIM